MARTYEIRSAFVNAAKRDSARRMSLCTADFVRALAAVKHEWSRAEANAWIQRNQPGWKLVSDGERGNSLYLLRNMGYTV